MDWSSITRFHGKFVTLVGFVLLLNPFVVSAYDIGGPDGYRYEPSEIRFYTNGTYEYETQALPLDPDVACFGDLLSRTCVLERAVHENGGITYDGPSKMFMSEDYSYVHIWGQGFFEPDTEESENGTVRYGLQPVPRGEALEDIATPISRTDHGIQAAIETGTYKTSDELPGAHELVRADDRYYVVYPAAFHIERGTERAGNVVALQWILGFTGAILAFRVSDSELNVPDSNHETVIRVLV